MAELLRHLADIYVIQDRFALAEAPLKRAVAIDERVLGPDHPKTLKILRNLAHLYVYLSDAAQAGPLYAKLLTKPNMSYPDGLHDLIVLYLKEGEKIPADTFVQQVLTRYEQEEGDADEKGLFGRLRAN